MAFQTAVSSTDWMDRAADLRTFALANGWASDRNASISANVQEIIMHGSGAGSDAIYVGIRTFYDTNADARNWELAGGTGYDSGATIWNNFLVGISPGRFDGGTVALQCGAYTPLQNTTITAWDYVNSRRILSVMKCGTAYVFCYLGWINPAATAGEYPYPLVIAGSTPVFDTRFNSSRVAYSGPADPQGFNSGATVENGPMMIRTAGGVWRTIRNAHEAAGNTRVGDNDRIVFPAGKPLINNTTITPDPADGWISTTFSFAEIISQSGVPGAPTAKLYKTDDSGGDKVKLFPATILHAPDASELIIAGELDGVYWCSAAPGHTAGGLVSEDTLTIGGDTYDVFASGNRTEDFAYFAVKRA